jgi:HEPN domain-containing protein
LDAAELLHAGKNRYAVYHCEQAAEKIIKAVLTSEGVHANAGSRREGQPARTAKAPR